MSNYDNAKVAFWGKSFDKFYVNVDKEINEINNKSLYKRLKDDNYADFYKCLVVHEFYSKDKMYQKYILSIFGVDELKRKSLVEHPQPEKLLPTIVMALGYPTIIAAILLGKSLRIEPRHCFSMPSRSTLRANTSIVSPVE
ncbi:hypothetical protein [Desulfovibrio intestinalis]|uniref:Uncharacterized protein n=1 Tax=Desulfovibrio intestinalis TaxID=58621 RepID=A0A7W8FED9_9BACT|nr:hypothetical protein [Desulfovibrio intestinalis]MBB5143674.1 hypothetical protein [Desulfovibrio intestinalis]